MTHGVTPEALAAALARTPDARAAFIVSPTYYGMAADVAGCAAVAHDAGVALVVDQSLGRALRLPRRAAAERRWTLGADAVLTSTHKLAGSLTQSAILHLGRGDRIDAARVARAVRIVRSTSPSSLLLASLDAARRQLAVHGEQLLHETIAAIGARAREAARGRRASSCSTRSWSGAPASPRYDPLRDRPRHARHGLHRRWSSPTRCARATTSTPSSRRSRRSCSSSGWASGREALLRLAGDVEEAVARLRRPGAETRADLPARRDAGARRRAARGVPRRRRARRRRRRGRAHLVRVDRRLPARASPRCCRASGSARRSCAT